MSVPTSKTSGIPAWDAIVSAAILGVDRQPSPAATTPGQLGELLALLPGTDPAAHLLSSAAAIALARRAGSEPRRESADEQHSTDPGSTGQPESTRCSDASDEHLAMMLRGIHPEVLPEWLAVASEAGRHVAAARLPALLERGVNDVPLRRLIPPVGGPVLERLRSANPRWKWASIQEDRDGDDLADPPLLKAAWEEGTPSERAAALEDYRRNDPADGRRRLMETWESTSSRERERLLRALLVGISTDDEPFLEEVGLGSRSKVLRETAASLLARIPSSALVERATGIVEGCTSKRGRAEQVKERSLWPPPSTFDPAWERDGLREDPPHAYGRKVGRRAWWLYQVLARIPPDRSAEIVGIARAELLDRVGGKDGDRAACWGLVMASIRHHDATWLKGIAAQLSHLHHLDPMPAIPGEPVDRLGVSREETLEALLCALENGERERLAEEFLKIGPGPLLLAAIAQSVEGVWSWQLGRAVIDRARQCLKSIYSCQRLKSSEHEKLAHLQVVLHQAQVKLPLQGTLEFCDDWPDPEASQQPAFAARFAPALDRFRDTLEFRSRMHEELIRP